MLLQRTMVGTHRCSPGMAYSSWDQVARWWPMDHRRTTEHVLAYSRGRDSPQGHRSCRPWRLTLGPGGGERRLLAVNRLTWGAQGRG